MELLEFSGELTGLMKAQEDAETITVPVVLVKRAVGVCDELKQAREEALMKPSVARKLNERIRSLEGELELLRSNKKVSELEKKVQFLEVELKNSYSTKNFTLKKELLELEKQYRAHIAGNEAMAALLSDVSTLLDGQAPKGPPATRGAAAPAAASTSHTPRTSDGGNATPEPEAMEVKKEPEAHPLAAHVLDKVVTIEHRIEQEAEAPTAPPPGSTTPVRLPRSAAPSGAGASPAAHAALASPAQAKEAVAEAATPAPSAVARKLQERQQQQQQQAEATSKEAVLGEVDESGALPVSSLLTVFEGFFAHLQDEGVYPGGIGASLSPKGSKGGATGVVDSKPAPAPAELITLLKNFLVENPDCLPKLTQNAGAQHAGKAAGAGAGAVDASTSTGTGSGLGVVGVVEASTSTGAGVGVVEASTSTGAGVGVVEASTNTGAGVGVVEASTNTGVVAAVDVGTSTSGESGQVDAGTSTDTGSGVVDASTSTSTGVGVVDASTGTCALLESQRLEEGEGAAGAPVANGVAAQEAVTSSSSEEAAAQAAARSAVAVSAADGHMEPAAAAPTAAAAAAESAAATGAGVSGPQAAGVSHALANEKTPEGGAEEPGAAVETPAVAAVGTQDAAAEGRGGAAGVKEGTVDRPEGKQDGPVEDDLAGKPHAAAQEALAQEAAQGAILVVVDPLLEQQQVLKAAGLPMEYDADTLAEAAAALPPPPPPRLPSAEMQEASGIVYGGSGDELPVSKVALGQSLDILSALKQREELEVGGNGEDSAAAAAGDGEAAGEGVRPKSASSARSGAAGGQSDLVGGMQSLQMRVVRPEELQDLNAAAKEINTLRASSMQLAAQLSVSQSLVAHLNGAMKTAVERADDGDAAVGELARQLAEARKQLGNMSEEQAELTRILIDAKVEIAESKGALLKMVRDLRRALQQETSTAHKVSELESILAVVMPWEGVGPPEESSGGAGVHSARSASAGPVLLQGRRRSSDSGGGGGMGGGGGGGATSGGGVGVGGIRNVILSGLSLKVGELVGGTTRYLGGGAAGGEQ